MATGNFINHKNGIYVLKETTFEEALEDVKMYYEEEDKNIEDITDEEVWEQKNELDRIILDDFKYRLAEVMLEKGLEVKANGYRYLIFRNDKILAELSLKDGYYSGCQVVVNTDKEYLKNLGYEVSKHNKTMFKQLKKATNQYKVSAYFSNGETFYEKVS